MVDGQFITVYLCGTWCTQHSASCRSVCNSWYMHWSSAQKWRTEERRQGHVDADCTLAVPTSSPALHSPLVMTWLQHHSPCTACTSTIPVHMHTPIYTLNLIIILLQLFWIILLTNRQAACSRIGILRFFILKNAFLLTHLVNVYRLDGLSEGN